MIDVITPTIKERAEMLEELSGDLQAQTYRDFRWHWSVDWLRAGPATIRNGLVEQGTAEWLAFVDDDDRLYSDHLETLIGLTREPGDVFYTACDITGRDKYHVVHDCTHKDLVWRNTIPVTTLVRRSMFEQVGGFPEEHDEDHGLWRAIRFAGGLFVCDHRVTWQYRFHGENRSVA